jgi:hypothetical protein
MPEESWEEVWEMAYRARDRVEQWLAAQHLPQPRAFIVETKDLDPRPVRFTFVARAGLLQESVQLPADVLRMNLDDPDLYAQCVADYLYRLLIRN